MMNPINPPSSADLSKISPEDLVQLYCAEPPLREAGEELSRRCLPMIQRIVGAQVFKRNVCPPQRSKTDFFEDAVGRACVKFIKGIRLFRFEASFSTWLNRVVESAVEEERLKVVGRGIDPNPIPEDLTVLEEKSPSDLPAAPYRSRHWIAPGNLVRDNEISKMIKEIFEEHGQESRRGADSGTAIKLHVIDECKKKEIAEKFGVSDRTVDRLFEHDYPALQQSLREKYGITSGDQV